MKAIEIQKLTKYYGKSRGIIDLDLTVDLGDFFGFIGPNGAGKSTTIRTLLGLIQPTEGHAFLMEKDIEKEKTEILKDVGYLPSEAVFYSGMRVKEVLKYSADLRKKDCHEEAQKLCERLQLDPMKKVEELSFGNRKKVAIVCALQHDPSLLILDEPTSGLDPLIQKEFFSILKERNEKGATIFLSSHILSEIQKNCTKAAIIREGKLVACDTVENLSKTKAKRIHLSGDCDLSSLEKAMDIKESDQGISFLYGGDLNQLIQVLSKQNVSDLSIH